MAFLGFSCLYSPEITGVSHTWLLSTRDPTQGFESTCPDELQTLAPKLFFLLKKKSHFIIISILYINTEKHNIPI